MKLRPYQLEAVEATAEALANNQAALTVMPTGTGKTIYFSEVIGRRGAYGRAIVVAHRRELLDQAARKIKAVTGETPDMEVAGEYSAERQLWKRARVILSTIQTQCGAYTSEHTKYRMHRFKPEDFGTMVVDEAHHSPAKTYRRVIDHYKQNPSCRVLGVTATPDRHDEKALGMIYDTVAYEMKLLRAIDEGWLVPILQQVVEVASIDLTTVKNTAGDLNAKDLARVMEDERSLWGVVEPTREIAGNRQTLIFASSVMHAERMAEMLNRTHPGKSAIVTGTTPEDERKIILRRFYEKDLQFLCNVDVATEGFDIPSVEVIAIARPTESRARYAQMVGRGTRPVCPVDDYDTDATRVGAIRTSSKPNCLVLDFIGLAGKHKLIGTADLLGGDYDDTIIERAKKNARAHGDEADMRDEIKQAVEELRLEEERLRDARIAVRGKVKYSARLMDPFAVFDLAAEREKPYFRGQPVTRAQTQFLEKSRVPNPEALTKQQASQLIGEIRRRWKNDECSYRQSNQLKKRGYPTRLPKGLASDVMTALAANKWNSLPDEHQLSAVSVREQVGAQFREPVRI